MAVANNAHPVVLTTLLCAAASALVAPLPLPQPLQAQVCSSVISLAALPTIYVTQQHAGTEHVAENLVSTCICSHTSWQTPGTLKPQLSSATSGFS